MTGLTPITAEERLLETMRLIQEYTRMAKGSSGLQVWRWATDAIAEYEAAAKGEPRFNVVVKGEINAAK